LKVLSRDKKPPLSLFGDIILKQGGDFQAGDAGTIIGLSFGALGVIVVLFHRA
jgi:hypothetical protein